MKSKQFKAEDILKSAQRVSDLYAPEIIDENAQTTEELAAEWGCSIRKTQHRILELTAAGKIEQVMKRGRARLVPAYRIKKK